MKPIYLIIILAIVATGCTIESGNNDNPEYSQGQMFKTVSTSNYDSKLCGSTSYENMPNGYNFGVKIILKDKNTGEILDGYSTVYTKYGGGNTNEENYLCKEKIDSKEVLVSSYAKGYAPTVFKFSYAVDQMNDIEVYLVKSCSGGQNYFDTLEISEEITGINASFNKNNVYTIIENRFGISKEDYTLDCIEAYNGRGGYIKAKGTHKDGSSFEMYYHGGWCSSSGADCGWEKCFSSDSETLFNSVKDSLCKNIYHDASKNNMCGVLSYDRNEEVREDCMTGAFEDKLDDNMRISVIQNSGRCESSVAIGNLNCIEN